MLVSWLGEAAGGLVAAGLLAAWWRSARRWRRSVAELERAFAGVAEGRPFRARRGRLDAAALRLAQRAEAAVNEQVMRRDRLGREVEQLQVVLGGMAEGVIAVDPRRRLLLANRSAELMFDLGPGDAGRLALELVRSPQFEEAVEATFADGSYRGEFALPGREPIGRAAPRVLAVHGAALPGDGPSGAVLVFRDVTDLRRLERMRQDFVANASHELKTPLAAIQAYTETLLDPGPHDPEIQARFLRRIAEQAARLDQLILDMLRLARLESGQEAFRHEPHAVADLLTACVENHRARAEAEGLRLSLDLGPVDAATRVVADPEAFRQVFDNLVDNAVKYTPEGGSIRVECATEPGWIEVAVADTGIGIPRDDLPRVFERFYRVDKARSRDLGGTGLGLSIVKHVVGSLGGHVTVESRLGEGTRFRVRLPRAPGRAERIP